MCGILVISELSRVVSISSSGKNSVMINLFMIICEWFIGCSSSGVSVFCVILVLIILVIVMVMNSGIRNCIVMLMFIVGSC